MSPPSGPERPSSRSSSRVASTRAKGTNRSRPGRLRTGEAIYLGAAILLFVLMFFHWFGTKASSASEEAGGLVSGSGGGSAWDALEVIPLFLMLAIVVAVGAALLKLGRSTWRPAIPPAAAVCVLGLLAALLILIRIVSPPGPDGALSELAYDTTLQLPVFLALAAALGIAYGGWRAMGEEGTTFGGIAQRLESPGRPRPRAPKSADESTPKSSSKAVPRPGRRPKS